MTLAFVIFAILAIIAVASAFATVSLKNPVHSAFALVVHFFMLSGLYLTLNAQFLAVIQVLVYAGAIMVLVIFVIMLLNLGTEESIRLKWSPRSYIGVALGLGLLAVFGAMLISSNPNMTFMAEKAAEMSSVQNLGRVLYSDYIFPVEAIAILLLAAIVGAIVLAKRNLN